MSAFEKNPPYKYKVGDQVRLKFPTQLIGRVMEMQGGHTPESHILYTIYVPMNPEPLIVPVREDEIEKV